MLNFLRKQMKWVMAIIVVAFLLSTFLMYEGRTTRRAPAVNADGTMADYEVASINGRSLMRSELERRLRDYLSTLGNINTASLDMPALYQAVLNQTILDSQLAREVEAQGIRVSDADADRAMKEYADMYYPTRETFYQVLAQSGVKVEDYKRSLARQMAVEQLLRNAIGDIEISEDRAIEFYDTMKPLIYSRPEGFNIHIADFKTSNDAEALRAKILGGESWDVIASNDELSSEDVINITKTPIFLPASTFRTGIFSVLASTDIGKPSPVITMSSNDYAVAMKTELVEATTTPYDEVSDDVKATLRAQEERNRLTAYQNSLVEKAQVVINDQELFARPAVSEDEEPEEELIPELVIEEVKEDEEEPETKEEVVVTEETPAEEQKDEPKEEAEAPAETPAEEAAVTEEAAATEEAKPEETPEAPAETPTAEETEETPETVTEESKPEDTAETPAEVVESEAEAVVEKVITKAEDVPLQEKVTEEIITPSEIIETTTEAVIDKPE